MNIDEKRAYEDFETIKTALEQARKNYSGFYKIIMRYGIVQLILSLSSGILANLMMSYSMYSIPFISFIPFILLGNRVIAGIYMLFFYFKTYKEEDVTSNKYYLSCLSMWGIIALALPFINLLTRGILILGRYTEAARASILLSRLNEYNMIIHMLLFCFCLIICSYMINKKYLRILAIIVFAVFLNLEIFFFGTSISQTGTHILTIYYNVCITLGYMGLSYVLKRGSKNGYK